MNPLLEQFLTEARDNLSYLDKNLSKLKDDNPDDVNALFRAAHTLKGGSGLVGFESIKVITHHAEDLLDAIRKKKILFQEDMLDSLYDAFDEIVELVDATEETAEIPEFEEQMIEALVRPIKSFLQMENSFENKEETPLETDLVIEKEVANIGHLIAHHSIARFAKELPLGMPKLTQEFIEADNFYCIDVDLDEQSVEFGNDPVYLVYLLGDEALYSVNTYIASSCEQIINEPLLWKTRFTLVVRSNKEALEDAFYNILDDIRLYPLNLQSLLLSTYEKDQSDFLQDFVKELDELIQKDDFSELSEKLSAINKILNPESFEGFMLSRLLEILPLLEFGSKEYREIVHFVASKLDITPSVKVEQKQDIKPQKTELSVEEKTAIDILQQQIKVLKHNPSEDSIKRIQTHVSNVLDFIGIEEDLSVYHDPQQLLQKLSSLIDSINAFDAAQAVEEIEETPPPPPPPPPPAKEPRVQKEQAEAKHSIPKTVKIDQADIDLMMDIVGEILVMKNALPYIANKLQASNVEESKREIYNKYEEISRITSVLQDKVMGMRLLPLSYIFNRYPKLVRDISKRLDKKIRFEEEGGETKLDKTMIELLADPLVHVIRNSLDHGIEEKEADRIQLGKDATGLIKIKAESKGDKVYISVIDDGRGIDLEKVISKALENKLATVEQIEAMSENEKYMLIFHPGLSTKDEISDLSGRGVGTDAVKKTVEELGGKITIQSEKNKGTHLTLELPVSVALTKIFHVKMDGVNYAIDMEQIVETLKISKSDVEKANQKPFIRVRGELVPLIFVPSLLPTDQESKEEQNVVVLEGKNSQYGLVVNEFVNQLDVVQKPLEGILANHPMVSGTSLLGNGEIIFILDATKIVDEQ